MIQEQINAESVKAAKKIREALEEFNRATGLTADIAASWESEYRIGKGRGCVVLARVCVNPVALGWEG